MLSKISLALNAILFLLVINLYLNSNEVTEVIDETDVVENEDKSLRIAYINTDTLDAKYLYAIDVVNELQDKLEKKQRSSTRKAEKLQQEYQMLQQAAQNMNQAQLQVASQRAMEIEMEMQNMQSEFANELSAEQTQLQTALVNEIDSFLVEYNKTAGYDFIIKKHNTSEVLVANQEYDITNDILDKINARYLAKKDSSK
jgi:outer membrane protein